MNPNGQGWLRKFADHKAEFLRSHSNLGGENADLHFYQILQPTGIIYGHPVQLVNSNYPRNSSWDNKGKMKVIFTEALIHGGYILGNFDGNLRKLITNFRKFYQIICPQIFEPKHRKGSDWDEFEYMIDRRLSITKFQDNNLISRYFHNSLLYTDAFFFGKWLSGSFEDHESLKKTKEKFMETVLKVIASAACSNNILEEEEKALFDVMLHSTYLSPELKNTAREFLSRKIELEDIDFSFLKDWLMRRYILELAVLMISSDKVVDNWEHTFLKRLANQLNLNSRELDEAIAAIQSFIIDHWTDLYYFQSSTPLYYIKGALAKRVEFFLRKNKDRLYQEILESKELIELLKKSRKEELTEVEKEKVRVQLKDILKTVPTFIIIALPFTFITLPLMIKLLPKSAFPTAFHD